MTNSLHAQATSASHGKNERDSPRVVLKHLPRVCQETSAELRSFLDLRETLHGSISRFGHVFFGGRLSGCSRSRHDGHVNRMRVVVERKSPPTLAVHQETSPSIDIY